MSFNLGTFNGGGTFNGPTAPATRAIPDPARATTKRVGPDPARSTSDRLVANPLTELDAIGTDGSS